MGFVGVQQRLGGVGAARQFAGARRQAAAPHQALQPQRVGLGAFAQRRGHPRRRGEPPGDRLAVPERVSIAGLGLDRMPERVAEIQQGPHPDLALVRDTLIALVQQEGRRRIGIDMTHVKCIPSGYFGMLFDWQERGVEIFLVDPQPSVRRMLWFRQFAERITGSIYRLTEEVQEELCQEGVGHWQDDLVEAGYASLPTWPAR